MAYTRVYPPIHHCYQVPIKLCSHCTLKQQVTIHSQLGFCANLFHSVCVTAKQLNKYNCVGTWQGISSIVFIFVSAGVNLLPNCDLSKRFWKEGVSFEHQYNSRLDPSYPPRGKVYNICLMLYSSAYLCQ